LIGAGGRQDVEIRVKARGRGDWKLEGRNRWRSGADVLGCFGLAHCLAQHAVSTSLAESGQRTREPFLDGFEQDCTLIFHVKERQIQTASSLLEMESITGGTVPDPSLANPTHVASSAALGSGYAAELAAGPIPRDVVDAPHDANPTWRIRQSVVAGLGSLDSEGPGDRRVAARRLRLVLVVLRRINERRAGTRLGRRHCPGWQAGASRTLRCCQW
jgi:hypothetical protein